MQRLAATKSRTDKEQIIFDAFMRGCHQFFIGAKLAIDPLNSFGVKKVAEILEDDGAIGTFTFDDFRDLASRLQARSLIGHAARDAIHAAAESCDFAAWNQFYRRILLKDLNVGVDGTTINKVLMKLLPAYPDAEQYLIPVFKCQLAHDGEDKAHVKKLRGKKLLDTKLDGMRVLSVMDKDVGLATMFSRNGLPLDTFPEILTALTNILHQMPGSLVFDGELMSPRGFQHLMSLVRRKEPHPDTAIIRYALFDIIPLKDFKLSHCPKTQRERRAILELLQENGVFMEETNERRKKLYVVPQIEVDLDTEAGQTAFRNFNRWALDEAFEGIMLKDPEAPYEGKRTAAWLKKKPTIEVSLPIVGVEPGDPDGKYAHTLGALVCEGVDLGVQIKTNVIGVSDNIRDQLWRDRDNIIGMIVEIIADKLTLEEHSTIYSLRFPRLKAFRGRVPGEKL